jgi:2-keto-4-pentenoate hydratase/2-oxohepta-3-ene-1,7-dioic acid hydratase in catechol pathway
MKLIRFGEPGREKPGVILSDGTRVDASGFGSDYDEAFFGGDGLARLRAWVDQQGRQAPAVPASVRLGAPVVRPSKIICIGLNFRDHAEESNMALPAEPVVFFKANSAYAGPDDDVVIPRGSQKTDWEVELGVVIGKRAS